MILTAIEIFVQTFLAVWLFIYFIRKQFEVYGTVKAKYLFRWCFVILLNAIMFHWFFIALSITTTIFDICVVLCGIWAIFYIIWAIINDKSPPGMD